MSSDTTTATIEPYLPAGFLSTSVPGPIEHLLATPFRRVYAAWLQAG